MGDEPDVFDTEEERKKNKDIKSEDFKDRIRYPLVMHVDDMEFEPRVPLLVITRTSYDLLVNEADIIKLHAWLSERIKHKHYKDARIRFIGRIES